MAGRMGGKRVTQLGLTVHEVDPEQNLLLVKGAVPGPEERARRGARLDGCSRRHPARRHGRQGEGRLARGDVFARRGQAAPRPRGRARRAERASRRDVGDQEPRARLRRPLQAVAPEGHGPRPRRHDPRRAVHGRRSHLRQGAAHLRPEGQPQGRQGRAALGARESRRAKGRSRSSTRPTFDEPSTKTASGARRDSAWLARRSWSC